MGTGGDVSMPVGDFFRWATRGTEERDEFPAEQTDAGEMKSHTLVLSSNVPFRQRDAGDPSAKRLGIGGCAIRGQPHDDIFVLIRSKSKIAGDGCIELAQRMRERNSLESPETAFFAHGHQLRFASDAPSATSTAARSKGDAKNALAA